MKRFFVGIVLLILTLFIGIVGYDFLQKPTDTLISPTGKYKVKLYGDKSRPWFFENTLDAMVLKNEQTLVEDQIHYGDWLDNSFESLYQKSIWIDDNTLSFRGAENQNIPNADAADSLTVVNKTDKEIKFLKVRFSLNMFLIFELPPHSMKTLYINHSKASDYINVAGEFTNGEPIKYRGVNFFDDEKDKQGGLFNYCASVGDDKVLINGIQVEGYETYPGIVIPKVKNCFQQN
jgi:hypothetical protein